VAQNEAIASNLNKVQFNTKDTLTYGVRRRAHTFHFFLVAVEDALSDEAAGAKFMPPFTLNAGKRAKF